MAGGIISRVAASIVLAGAAIMPAVADDTGFASMHDLRREGGRLCMIDHFHFGSGSGGSKAAAQREAIISWSSFTDFEYGSDWARWSRAASKGITCTKGGGGIDCQVQARPCK
jgi:hypothetical protein